RPNRRGNYDSIASGYSHGQGQLHPTNFSISTHNQPAVQQLLDSPEMQNVARFLDHMLLAPSDAYFPKIHRLLANLTHIFLSMEELRLKHNSLMPLCSLIS
ncbi:hypothetical protein BDP27DRAFT_1508870, partial [Rhodocollybia butyracea]